jgi:hypothetical protein
MKVIVVHWRNPVGDLQQDQFEADKVKVATDPGWLKLYSKEEGAVMRLLPSDKVCLVEFGEVKEKPRILTPADRLPDQLLREGN